MANCYEERRQRQEKMLQDLRNEETARKMQPLLKPAIVHPKKYVLPTTDILPQPERKEPCARFVPEEGQTWSNVAVELEAYFHCKDFDKPMPVNIITETHAASVSRFYFELLKVKAHWKNRKPFFETIDREFAENIRIIEDRQQLGDKAHFAVELIRKPSERRMVHFADVVKEGKPFDFVVGEDLENNIVTSSLAKAKSMLVTGESGSGKSVFVKNMLASLCMTTPPNMLDLYLVDYKGTELNHFADMPHTKAKLITSLSPLLTTIQYLIFEMNRRYEEMQKRSLVDMPPEMPRIMLVIEELAAAVMSIPGKDRVKLFFEPLAQIAQKGRAAGFHLLLAPQKPTIDIIGKQVNPNIQTKIGMKAASGNESKIAIDALGLEELGGNGDMLVRMADNPALQRIQSPFIDTPTIQAITNFWKEQAK